MTELERFDYGPFGTTIRVVRQGGQPMFILSDLAKALGYRDAEKAKRLVRHSQCGTLQEGTWRDLGGRGSAPNIVTEGGLYRLALRSDRPEADAFQDWVTDEVLPSLRRDGFYLTPDATADQLERAKQEADARLIRLEERKSYRNVLDLARDAGAESRDYADLQNHLYLRAFGMTAKTVMARQPLIDKPASRAFAKDHLTDEQLKRIGNVVMGVCAHLGINHPDGTATLGDIHQAIDHVTHR